MEGPKAIPFRVGFSFQTSTFAVSMLSITVLLTVCSTTQSEVQEDERDESANSDDDTDIPREPAPLPSPFHLRLPSSFPFLSY